MHYMFPEYVVLKIEKDLEKHPPFQTLWLMEHDQFTDSPASAYLFSNRLDAQTQANKHSGHVCTRNSTSPRKENTPWWEK